MSHRPLPTLTAVRTDYKHSLNIFFPPLHCCNPQGPLSLDVLLPVALCSLFLALFFLSVDKLNPFQPHCRGLFQWRGSGLYSQSRNYCSLWGGWPLQAPVCRISTCAKPVWQSLLPQCIHTVLTPGSELLGEISRVLTVGREMNKITAENNISCDFPQFSVGPCNFFRFWPFPTLAFCEKLLKT